MLLVKLQDFFEIAKTYLPRRKLVNLQDDYTNISCYLSGNVMTGFAIENNINLKRKKTYLYSLWQFNFTK